MTQQVSMTGVLESGAQQATRLAGDFRLSYPGTRWRYIIFLVIFTILAIIWTIFSIIDSVKCSKYSDKLDDENWSNANPDLEKVCTQKTYIWVPIILWLIPITIFLLFYFMVLKTCNCLKKAGKAVDKISKCVTHLKTREGVATGVAGGAVVAGMVTDALKDTI
mgnify:CR=1 FL=1